MSTKSVSTEEKSLIQEEKPKRKGPPNRMNDLDYSTWMKFQKSFFNFETTQKLAEEHIYFFTKALWEGEISSRTLFIGLDNFQKDEIPSPRIIESYNSQENLEAINEILKEKVIAENKYDYVLIDLRQHLNNAEDLRLFLDSYSQEFFANLKNVLYEQKYCSVLVGVEGCGGGGFPLPWSVAMSSREYVRLRDEKVALINEENKHFYTLFMQNQDDNLSSNYITPDNIKYESLDENIKGWLLPRTPPRKKNEILHPAKYPETLVESFLKDFTDVGDSVFDPMLGTGSTIVAALRNDRNGYGIELSEEYKDIAQNRAEQEFQPTLFEEFFPSSEYKVVHGNAFHLDSMKEFEDIKFDYSITSPPYWSMLRNKGSENQRNRRKKDLALYYSEEEADLGNIENYGEFLDNLELIYNKVADKLREGSVITIVVKNVKKNHTVYPLAWDLVQRLCGLNDKYSYLGTTLWCQDNIGLKPFAVGTHWVSNTLHQYCIHLKKS
ncbi:DNA modification methylase [Salimicrobium jeotgali]|uniref:Methyltransferase n=1 Tax=Salimicrobium jeotgali TaxID=1230341 RepID=K2GAF1_9BACI|nr:site-specific DNA-methyltransferase [Salimicrobium jeotgali]AKG05317.1 DNA modification methylase [Salimicrobium jeotgali]EKE31322.1 DNA modification methylase-like protein [Salimicrobium jeotgali]MBM7696931.1 DNA modification methylase [Salimicrobium jeotgali]